jgi:hypothetical protein
VAVAVDEGVTPVDARSSSIGGHATFVAVATLQDGEHRADLFALLTHLTTFQGPRLFVPKGNTVQRPGTRMASHPL